MDKNKIGISVLFTTQTELKDAVYQKKNLSGHWDLLIALAKLNTEYLYYLHMTLVIN